MKRARLIKETERGLNAGGYATVLASNMHTCADVFAERKGEKFVIKIVNNIDSITGEEAESLRKLAQFLDAEPLVLGRTSKNARLCGEVTHYRFSIRCMSPEMLPNLSSNEPSLLASKFVGVKIKIDGEGLRNLRKINNLKIAELAKEAKMSKATLYKHERTGGYASITTVSRLERILHRSIRVATTPENIKIELHPNRLARSEITTMRLERAPFDMVAKSRNYYEISLDANIRTLIKRAALFKSLRETFEHNYPFFIKDKKSGDIAGVPAIKKSDFVRVSSEEELLDMVY